MKYLIYGKPGFYNGNPQISHPEIEPLKEFFAEGKPFLEPVYSTTEKLKTKGLNARQIGKLTSALLNQLSDKDIPENIPSSLTEQLVLENRLSAFFKFH